MAVKSIPARILFCLLLGAAWPVHPASSPLAAFPGAEGAGALATGGRGGDVYCVTNLHFGGAGSFAEGIATVPAAGRTIVFGVSGYIPIRGTLRLTKPRLTIAGQTAPGDGIGFTNGTLLISARDVVIRHVRFRNGYSADTVNLDSNATNCILDHCDVLFGKDENLSSFKRPPENFTFQWSVNAWGLEPHSCGGLWDQLNATCHHSLWAHNHTRNPKARPGMLDWVNNVTFDWDIGFILGDSQSTQNWRANVRGSWFICPPGNLRPVALEKARLATETGKPNFTLFIEDSALDADGDGRLSVSKTDYAIAAGEFTTHATAFAAAGFPVTRDDRLTAYKKLVSAVGPLRLDASAARPLRDEVGAILVRNLVEQKRHHIYKPAETGAANGGFGELQSAPAPVDTDRDGMPDYWEAATGSDVQVATHNQPVPPDAFVPAGYTRLEEYLQFLAQPHAVVEQGTTLTVDLSKFTSGFVNGPVFKLSIVTNGTAELAADGVTVRFTPKLDFSGRARFHFTVTDAEGSTWTQPLAILVTPK